MISERFLETFDYIFRGVYSAENTRMAQIFLEINRLVLEIPEECLEINVDNRAELLWTLSRFVRASCGRDWSSQLLRTQVELAIFKNVFEASLALAKLRELSSGLNVFEWVLMERLAGDFCHYLEYHYKSAVSNIFEDFMRSQYFISEMVESAQQHELLWAPCRDSETNLDKIENSIRLARQARRRVKHRYAQMALKTKQLGMDYFYYLHYVERDLKTSRQVLSSVWECPDLPVELPRENVVILAVSLEADSFARILNISPNVLGVLGYTKENMVGITVHELVPEFCRDFHKRRLKQVFENFSEDSQLYNFNRKTLCENSAGLLYEVGLHLKLTLYNDRLAMIGYFEVVHKSAYRNWLAVDHRLKSVVAHSNPSSQEEPLEIEYVPGAKDHETILINHESYKLYRVINTSEQETLHLYENFAGPYMMLENVVLQKDLVKQVSFSKHFLPANSTIPGFLETKQALLQGELNRRRGLVKLVVLLVLLLAGAVIAGAHVQMNRQRTYEKLVNFENSHTLVKREANFILIMTWLHFIVLQEETGVVLGTDFDDLPNVFEGVKISGANMNTYGQVLKATETLTTGKRYQVASFELIESIRTHSAYILENFFHNAYGKIEWVLGYVLSNEYELIRNVMVSYKNFHVVWIKARIQFYINLWYAFQVFYCFFVIAAFFLLGWFDRMLRVADCKVAVALFSIGLRDRREFVRTIRFYLGRTIHEVKDAEAPAECSDLGNILAPANSESRSNLSSSNVFLSSLPLSPSGILSPSLSEIRCLKSRNSQRLSKSMTEEEEPAQKHVIKMRSVSPLRVALYLAYIVCAVALSVFTIVNSFKMNFASTPFVINIFNQHNLSTFELTQRSTTS